MELHDRDQISLLAYELWRERGCPEGSPEVDWDLAEEILAALKRDLSMLDTVTDLDRSGAVSH